MRWFETAGSGCSAKHFDCIRPTSRLDLISWCVPARVLSRISRGLKNRCARWPGVLCANWRGSTRDLAASPVRRRAGWTNDRPGAAVSDLSESVAGTQLSLYAHVQQLLYSSGAKVRPATRCPARCLANLPLQPLPARRRRSTIRSVRCLRRLLPS